MAWVSSLIRDVLGAWVSVEFNFSTTDDEDSFGTNRKTYGYLKWFTYNLEVPILNHKPVLKTMPVTQFMNK